MRMRSPGAVEDGPQVFRRRLGSRIVGLLAYTFLGLAAGVLGLALGSLVGFAAWAVILPLSEGAQPYALGAGALTGGLGAVLLTMRVYRRRRRGEVRLHHDRLEWEHQGRVRTVRWEQFESGVPAGIDNIGLADLRLPVRGGEPLVISAEQYPVKEIGERISERLSPRARDELEARLAAGPLVLSVDRSAIQKGIRAGIVASLFLTGLMVLWIRSWLSGRRGGWIWIPIGLAGAVTALQVRLLFDLLALRKLAAVEISESGARTVGDPLPWAPWSDLTWKSIPGGLILMAPDRAPMLISTLAPNFTQVAEWIRSRTLRER